MTSTEPPAPVVLSGRYEIHRRLARGGMAEVFLARDSALDRPVAVKVLFPEFSTDPAFVERFRREAQAAANLSHPNIVGVYDWGAENGTYFIVMEYVDGQSLAEVLRSAGPLHPKRVAEVAFEVAGALGHAHQRGVVHRDVKPGNVLVNSAGAAKVTDFGIARALSEGSEDLTQAGSVMGTATYFSPEQAQGFAVDARSDLYSLGVVMFELLCGRPPFAGESPVAIAYKHVQENPPRPSELVSGLPGGIEAVVMKLLAKDPGARYLSADDLRADLRRWLDGQPTVAESSAAPAASSPGADATVANPVAAGEPTRVVGAATAAAAYAANGPVVDAPGAEPIPDEDEEGAKRSPLFASLLAVLLAALVGLGVWIYLSMDDKDAAANKTVPGVVNQQEQEARDALTSAGFNPVVNRQPSDSAVAGIVFDQTPKAGAEAPEGSDVVIFVSIGPAEIELPADLVGDDAEQARKRLEAQGLKVTMVEVDDDEIEAGRVVSTNPAVGSKVPAESTVELRVSKGKGNVPIPDVGGMTFQDAKVALVKAGFIPGADPRSEASTTVAKDRVIGTDPLGTAPKGSTVWVIVSSGPDQVTVPVVKGQREDDARATLKDAGLTNVEVEVEPLPAGSASIGRVIDVNPAAGTKVSPSATITLKVGVQAAATTTTTGATTTTASATTTTTTP